MHVHLNLAHREAVSQKPLYWSREQTFVPPGGRVEDTENNFERHDQIHELEDCEEGLAANFSLDVHLLFLLDEPCPTKERRGTFWQYVHRIDGKGVMG